jgi:hypothetical protein
MFEPPYLSSFPIKAESSMPDQDAGFERVPFPRLTASGRVIDTTWNAPSMGASAPSRSAIAARRGCPTKEADVAERELKGRAVASQLDKQVDIGLTTDGSA